MSMLVVLLVALSTLVANTVAVDEYVIMDVEKSEEMSERDLLNKLRNIDMKFKFKISGTSKYVFVFRSIEQNMNELDNVTLPGKVSVLPSQDLAQAMEEMEIIWPQSPLTDSNIALFKTEFSLKDQTSKQYNASYTSYGLLLKDKLQGVSYAAFRSSGATPPKHYFFVNVEREDVEDYGQQGIDIWGGPGEVNSEAHYMVMVR